MKKRSVSSITVTELKLAGVRNLTEFGYENVTADNIATDYLFRKFFVRMLDDTLAQVAELCRRTAIEG